MGVDYRNQLSFTDLKLSVGYMDICLIIFDQFLNETQ